MSDDRDHELQPTETAGEDWSADETVSDLIAVCTSLITVIERETKMLTSMRPGEIRALQDEKSTLALTYGQQVKQLAIDPKSLRTLESALRDELRSVLTRLETARLANETALQAAREANERVIQCIVEAVAETQARATTYGPDGGRAGAEPKRGDDPISISVNEKA